MDDAEAAPSPSPASPRRQEQQRRQSIEQRLHGKKVTRPARRDELTPLWIGTLAVGVGVVLAIVIVGAMSSSAAESVGSFATVFAIVSTMGLLLTIGLLGYSETRRGAFMRRAKQIGGSSVVARDQARSHISSRLEISCLNALSTTSLRVSAVGSLLTMPTLRCGKRCRFALIP